MKLAGIYSLRELLESPRSLRTLKPFRDLAAVRQPLEVHSRRTDTHLATHQPHSNRGSDHVWGHPAKAGYLRHRLWAHLATSNQGSFIGFRTPQGPLTMERCRILTSTKLEKEVGSDLAYQAITSPLQAKVFVAGRRPRELQSNLLLKQTEREMGKVMLNSEGDCWRCAVAVSTWMTSCLTAISMPRMRTFLA